MIFLLELVECCGGCFVREFEKMVDLGEEMMIEFWDVYILFDCVGDGKIDGD